MERERERDGEIERKSLSSMLHLNEAMMMMMIEIPNGDIYRTRRWYGTHIEYMAEINFSRLSAFTLFLLVSSPSPSLPSIM